MTPTALRSVVLALALSAPAIGEAQVSSWPAESPPRPLAARSVKFPPYETRMLANGLQVVVVQHHEQPVVSLRLIVRAGSVHDPQGKQGTAALAAGLLDQGTASRTAQQIAQAIDSIGGGLGSGAGSDLSYVTVVVLNDSLQLGLDLMADVVRNPAFTPNEVERIRQQALSALKVNYEDPDYVAGLVFDRLVYGFHPYGLPDTGTPRSLAAVTPADLRAFHGAYYVPNNTVLAVVGDVTPADAFKGVERVFGSWARRDVPATTLPDPPEPTRRVVVVNKADAVQTEVRVGHLGLPRNHPDFMAYNLLMRILGGEGGNRLQRVLRSERGLTYAASVETAFLKRSGDFAADTETRSDATAEVLRAVVDEISRLQRERVADRELAEAQAYLTGSFPLTIETPDAIAAQVLNVLFYDLPLADLETFRERANAVTPDDIQRVARAYLKPDRLSVVLVGNAAAFVGRLAGVGFPRIEQIELGELDLSTADLRQRRGATDRPARTQ